MTSALNHRYPSVQGELETELESEFETENELEFEDESEFEDENELEFEDEAFLGALGGIARGIGGLLGGSSEFETEDEFESEFEFEFEAEAELEDEGEGEDEAFVNPVQRIYRDAELMAHLSRQAASVEGEGEAEAFIGALVPLAARLIPRAATLVTRNAPALIRTATTIARQLRRRPDTRRLVQALPVVLQRTAQSLADQASSGRPVTEATAARTLARAAGQVLSTPDSVRSAVRAIDIFDRRYRRRARPAARTRRSTVPHAGGPAYQQDRRPQPSRRQQRRAGSEGNSRAARRARRPR